ncbi:hypothetical protein PG985_009460 [Apiospora marii]|uniref:Uncharacterized protein n=1 Tax=Apiospora marii TaxID=335849 RepID=A0ABR1RFF6_9PEZI
MSASSSKRKASSKADDNDDLDLFGPRRTPKKLDEGKQREEAAVPSNARRQINARNGSSSALAGPLRHGPGPDCRGRPS